MPNDTHGNQKKLALTQFPSNKIHRWTREGGSRSVEFLQIPIREPAQKIALNHSGM